MMTLHPPPSKQHNKIRVLFHGYECAFHWLVFTYVQICSNQTEEIPRYFAAGCHRMTGEMQNISVILPNMATIILMYEHFISH